VNYSLHPIGEITPSTLAEMARLHESTMRLLLSEMGSAFVLRYFEAAANDPAVIGFYAMSEFNEVIGYVVGTPRPAALNAQLTRSFPWFLGQCFRLLLTRPYVLWQALLSSSAQPGQMEGEANAIELVYVAVDPKGRGQGVGRALMQSFEDASRAAGYRRIVASQELDNEASIRLFSSMGYQVKQKYREGRYERQRVELLLQSE
jgi:ribosomal protein S18 acetylase RimI-like enzyme